jgi:hypothetical protein
MATKGKYGKIMFSEEDIQFIKDNFQSMTNQQIADALGLKKTRVRTKAYELGLKRMELEYWTPKQVKFLKENYKEIGDSELAEIFSAKWYKAKGWTKKHIEKKRRYLKLKRTKLQIKKIHKRNVLMGRFKDCPINAWKTRGVAKIGDKRVWYRQDDTPFVVIKEKYGFVHYNRWLWEKHFGPIPKGMNVKITSDDKINYTEKDLILITNAENAILNSKNRLPPELQETFRLIKKINKQYLKMMKNE